MDDFSGWRLNASPFSDLIDYTYDKQDVIWYSAKDIATILQNLHIRSVVNAYDKSERCLIERETIGGNQSSVYLSIKGVKRLLCSSRKPHANELAEAFGIDVSYIKYTCAEHDILKALKETFNGESMIEQYKVDTFFFDLYMPQYKLAIECDENGHSFRVSQDNAREERIKNIILGVTFIRLHPDEKDFNIYKSINMIYQHIINHDKQV